MERIRRSTHTHQWHYVPTQLNPADHATRALPAEQLSHSTWLSGPAFLTDSGQGQVEEEVFNLIDPERDTELRPEIVSCATNLSKGKLGTARFERFSDWSHLLKAVAMLSHIAISFKGVPENACHRWHKCDKRVTEEQLQQTKATIIREVQREVYADDIRRMEQGESLSKQSPLNKLNPFMDTNAVLRVGGRLARVQMTTNETYPILLPSKHHITQLVIRHVHALVRHQSRHFTEGAIRAAGFWIVGGKRAISSVIFNCVTCRRLRGKQQEQIMSDLPADRMHAGPPFTFVGRFWPMACYSQKNTRRPSRG